MSATKAIVTGSHIKVFWVFFIISIQHYTALTGDQREIAVLPPPHTVPLAKYCISGALEIKFELTSNVQVQLYIYRIILLYSYLLLEEGMTWVGREHK